jgi:threonine synthase
VFEDKPSPERRLLNYEVQMIYHGEKPFHMAEVDFKKIMSNLNEFQRERAQQLVSEWREDQNENIEKTFFNNENL